MATKPLTQTTGRRKEAVARVRLRPGNGTHVINGRPFEAYFTTAVQRMVVSEALRVTETEEQYDIDATIHGGGVSGQAGALRLGIAGTPIVIGSRGTSTPKRWPRCSISGRVISMARAISQETSTRSFFSSILPRLMRETSRRSSTSLLTWRTWRSITDRSFSELSSPRSFISWSAVMIGASGLRSSWPKTARNSSLR